jgi:hypothetical protein
MSPQTPTGNNQDPTIRPRETLDINNTERPTAPWKMRSANPNTFRLGDLEGHEFRIGDGIPEEVNEFFRSVIRNRPVVKYNDLPKWILQYEIKDAKERREKMKRKIQAEKDTNRAWLVAEMRKRIALKKEEEKVNDEMKQKVDVREQNI